MNVTLRIWRQHDRDADGRMVGYGVDGISPDMSFLEMLDVLNEQLTAAGDDPVAFDNDCREGICGMCSLVINGIAHGPEMLTATCQLYMRHFDDGDTIDIEPWRSPAFPILRDLIVDRSAFDRIVQAGGYISAPPGRLPTRQPRWYQRRTQTVPSTPPPASAAEPALQPAPMAQRCSSPGLKQPTSGRSRKARSSATRVLWPWLISTMPRASAAAPKSANARPCARSGSRWT